VEKIKSFPTSFLEKKKKKRTAPQGIKGEFCGIEGRKRPLSEIKQGENTPTSEEKGIPVRREGLIDTRFEKGPACFILPGQTGPHLLAGGKARRGGTARPRKGLERRG